MSLVALQRDFSASLRREQGGDDEPGMAVYRNNYRSSLAACLEDSFARTRQWIGAVPFSIAVVRHVERVPPSSWTLDAYPRDFPDTLRIVYPNDPEIAELAWMECALGEAFVVADMPALAPEALARTDWDSAVLHLTPTLDMREASTNAALLWSAMAAGGTPPAAEILSEPCSLLVWRQDYISRFRMVDQQEAEALLSVRSGQPFASLCGSLVETLGEEAGIRTAGEWLGRWAGDGLIVGIAA